MAKRSTTLVAPTKAVDPTLSDLFASSSGPVKAPSKSKYVGLLPQKTEKSVELEEEAEEEDGEEEENSDGEQPEGEESDLAEDDDSEELSSDNKSQEEEDGEATNDDDEEDAAETLEALVELGQTKDRKRKRKNRDENEDIESKYLQKLVDEPEPTGKRQKKQDNQEATEDQETPEDVVATDDVDMSDEERPVHESLAADPEVSDLDKANRTVFLSNVSSEAIKSSRAKKTLLAHLGSVLDKKAIVPQTIESIRFRSVAYSSAGVPKRASFAKKSVMDATTKSANAYVVYSDEAGARAAISQLNGTTVLDRHLRVDSVAHPAPIDHRRCVFVGNLGFVDDESILDTAVDEEGNELNERRKRNRVPMDIEEGLWRVFNKEAGKIESVRVVRDPVTRVGKGFAYVQFYDGTSVEAALLLADKKFPPMLPRKLRVARCRAPSRTARALEARVTKIAASSDKKKSTKYVPKPTAEAQTLAGRAEKLLGRAGAAQLKSQDKKAGKFRRDSRADRDGEGDGEGKSIKTPEEIVFEGRRASARDGKPKDLKFKGSRPAGGKGGKKRRNHTTSRTASWRGKKREDK